MMIEIVCDNCGKKVKKFPRDLRRSRTKKFFCNSACFNEFQSDKKIVFCNDCGTKLIRKPSNVNKKNFCNQECYYNWQKNNKLYVNVRCDNCGEGFTRDRCRTKNKEHQFCSNTCQGLFENKQVKFNCTFCKEGVYIPRYRLKFKNYFCNEYCYYKWEVGENNSMWRGGYFPYRGPDWQRQRKRARWRDNFTCQLCGEKENGKGEHAVHHIIPFREFGLERYKDANRLKNLITLCSTPCHYIAEKEVRTT